MSDNWERKVMRGIKSVFTGLLAAALPLMASGAVRAETTEVRFAQQFAFTYLQINVMKHQQLVSETINQIRGRFVPKVADIKKCIEILLDKEYLERLEDEELGYLA